ncbi:MAG: S-layer homology domain-containing protein, partial [Chromatiaceae bacterium]|nr:S-layer homology domain-containing protein [Chromatiaceae bacterium]
VSPDAWSCRYIQRLSELNITGGCGGGNYCPQGLVTREQMAAFIVRAVEGEPALDYCGGVAPFLDVAPSTFFCRYIKRLVELGVTQGCGNGNYCPGNEVTREQMAAFLARAFLDMD